MIVDFFSPTQAKDIRYFSGIPYHIYSTLSIKTKVNDIEGYSKFSKIPGFIKKKSIGLFSSRLIDCNLNHSVMRQVGKSISGRINRNSDAIISPVSTYLSYVKSSTLKVFWHDAPFGALVNYYDSHSNFSTKDIKIGNEIQEKAILNSDIAVFSSEWARDFAYKNYNLGNKKIHVIPYGANFKSELSKNELSAVVKNRIKSSKKELLFIGMDWERKNGPMVLKILRILINKGLDVHLNIIGCSPDIPKDLLRNVKAYGLLDKSKEEELSIFLNVLHRSHLLMGLSKAEAFGILFCEANSFGIPCIAANTGGIPTIIKDGVNGRKFNLLNDFDVVEYIESVLSNNLLYTNLSLNSYLEYSNRLNWESGVLQLMNLISNAKRA